MSASLFLAEARRIALKAQMSPGASRGSSPPTAAAITRLVRRLGLLQIDSVNVLSRAHYLPVFSRLGPYDRALLDRLTYGGRGRVFFEYWAHEASFLPIELYPLFRWRMEDARHGRGIYGSLARFAREEPHYIARALEAVRSRGPLAARDLPDPGKRIAGWWGWSPGKIALEYLFWTGEVTAATRHNFERFYDLPDRVLPSHLLNAPAMTRADAIRRLMFSSAKALGIGTLGDLRDYFRLPLLDAKRAVSELLEEGMLEEAAVEGWRSPALVIAGAPVPRSTPACRSLLSPFDPLIWERTRTERLFRFSYRLEIYTPAHKRRYGYYVLPFLSGDRFTARLCLKADRQRSLLRVNAAHAEPGAELGETAAALGDELRALATFLDLSAVAVGRRGNLARALKTAL